MLLYEFSLFTEMDRWVLCMRDVSNTPKSTDRLQDFLNEVILQTATRAALLSQRLICSCSFCFVVQRQRRTRVL